MRLHGAVRGPAIAAASLLTLFVAALAAGRAAADVPPPDACAAISPHSLSAFGRTVAAAQRWASADASKNGTSGTYAVAATNSRDLLARAADRVASAVSDLESTIPSVTTAAEAGTVKEHLRYVLEIVPQAAHWAIVSEIYHDSPDARKAFEGSVKVLAEGNALFADAGRCYMDGL